MKLQQGEQILHELGPQPSILFAWCFSKGLPGAFFAAFLAFWFFGFFGGIFTSSTRVLAIGAIAALVVATVALFVSPFYLHRLRKTYRYHVTNLRCVFTGGIFRRVERSVPYHKITDVEISQNLLERVLRISNLRIFTPASTGSRSWPFSSEQAEIEFVGLKDAETPAATVNGILATFKATGE